ncbi:MAG: acetyltransferase [Hyphomicrobiales bacterium]|nr:acetyltransferase [Hyphomicrobiales bacterium]MCP5001991.1 acetyltransferase [Hyphomicrobiales bacterium]
MIQQWLRTPEARRWWGDPDEQFNLIAEDLKDSRMVTLLVELDDRPFAYLQHYEVHIWPQEHLAVSSHQVVHSFPF